MREVGEENAARALGVSRQSIARACAGFPVRNTIATTIRVNLEQLALIERVSRI